MPWLKLWEQTDEFAFPVVIQFETVGGCSSTGAATNACVLTEEEEEEEEERMKSRSNKGEKTGILNNACGRKKSERMIREWV